MTSPIVGLDHVQLAMPAGAEDTADRFYAGLLGLDVEAKPDVLAGRGGRWYRAGATRIHLGVDPDFRPAGKAHPALVIDDLAGLVAVLEHGGHPYRADAALEGHDRGFVDDPFGNRIELIQK